MAVFAGVRYDWMSVTRIHQASAVLHGIGYRYVTCGGSANSMVDLSPVAAVALAWVIACLPCPSPYRHPIP